VRRAGVSPVLATVVLIAISLIALISFFGFESGLFGSFATIKPFPVSATINPQIYSSAGNVGIVNQVANFTIVAVSNFAKPQTGLVSISRLETKSRTHLCNSA